MKSTNTKFNFALYPIPEGYEIGIEDVSICGQDRLPQIDEDLREVSEDPSEPRMRIPESFFKNGDSEIMVYNSDESNASSPVTAALQVLPVMRINQSRAAQDSTSSVHPLPLALKESLKIEDFDGHNSEDGEEYGAGMDEHEAVQSAKLVAS